MRIQIKYSASWRNSFLDGDNNSPLPKSGRKYIASMTTLKKKKNQNFLQREITKDTVMGILNRVIGDQRKLYQSRKDPDYFFRDMEEFITFEDHKTTTDETVYLRNMKGNRNTDQNSFSGIIQTSDPIFSSDYSQEFWGLLDLDLSELQKFIADESYRVKDSVLKEDLPELDPLSICQKFEEIGKRKPVKPDAEVEHTLEILHQKFPDTSYKTASKKDTSYNKTASKKVTELSLYCSGLYLQIERLGKRFDTGSALTKQGKISGISKNHFTKKNFMGKYTTGGEKRIWGNPYMLKEFVKGSGAITRKLQKAEGTLEIKVDVPAEKSEQIKQMIENAGVSAFYLGKKGLAYIDHLSLGGI